MVFVDVKQYSTKSVQMELALCKIVLYVISDQLHAEVLQVVAVLSSIDHR